MTPKVRDYTCPEHGVFEATIDWESPDDLFDQPCPQCGRRCELDRYVAPDSPPAVHDDVRRPYYNPQKGMWVTCKQDLRDYHQRTDTVPLSDRDLENAVDEVAVEDREGREDQKWYDREVEAGRGPVLSSGDMPL